MGKVFFVSGIDTGVGKTVVTGLMARYLLARGVRAATIKIVQTGNVGYSEDRDEHRRFMGRTLPEDELGWTAPQIFAFPASPHLAAALEKRTVDTDKIRSCCGKLAERYDAVLAEGAGGLAVPLTPELLTADLAAEMDWPLILVIVFSWGIAFFEYCLLVPANRIGFIENGGPFNLMQLKVIQEVISVTVFSIIVTFLFKGQPIQWNHIAAFLCLIMAVFFVFLK